MATKKKINKKATGGSTRRPKPVVPKAGFRKGRYGRGGKLK